MNIAIWRYYSMEEMSGYSVIHGKTFYFVSLSLALPGYIMTGMCSRKIQTDVLYYNALNGMKGIRLYAT